MRGPWKSYTHHDFVQQLGRGTLPNEVFKNYLVQDYLYLVGRLVPSWICLILVQTHFARTNALAAYKSTSMDSISAVSMESRLETRSYLVTDTCSRPRLCSISKERCPYILTTASSLDFLNLR